MKGIRCEPLSYKEEDLLRDLETIVKSYLYVLFKLEDFEVKFDLLRSLRLAFEKVLSDLGLREKPLLDNVEAGVAGALRYLYHEITRNLFGISSLKVIDSKKKGKRLQVSSGKNVVLELKLKKDQFNEIMNILKDYNGYSYRLTESASSKTYELLNPLLVYEVLKRYVCPNLLQREG